MIAGPERVGIGRWSRGGWGGGVAITRNHLTGERTTAAPHTLGMWGKSPLDLFTFSLPLHHHIPNCRPRTLDISLGAENNLFLSTLELHTPQSVGCVRHFGMSLVLQRAMDGHSSYVSEQEMKSASPSPSQHPSPISPLPHPFRRSLH
ncbi:hypothetical protein PoB_000629500 [Plakobranchus ocellatus]|uniref:Uncharacterized protein n=1 Tax=Plakobranchus ocellatus TaxID=259542 RepID=A0AAV3Y9L3_9GAST|nr:hypothetical protein PoB_000629500 [Plakobranchus ocellatus]